MSYESVFSQRRVLVTGGLGFLGSNLALRLSELGARVTVLDCILPVHGGNPFNLSSAGGQIEWVKGDIRDEALVHQVLKGKDFLFNIAAQTSHTDSLEQPLLDADINTRGQLILLEACRRTNASIRVVYCSTRAVYGSQSERLISEDLAPNPMDIYATNKLAGEFYHRIYSAVHGLKTVILRVANGYGPRAQMKQPSFGILNWFIRLAIDDQEIKIFGDGKQVRDYLYVDDITDAFLRAAASDASRGEIFNVASGKGVPLIDIVKQVVKIAGKGKIVHVPWPEKNKKIDVGDFVADISRLKRKMKWKPATSLAAGLKKTIEYYEAHKWHYW